MEQKRTVLNFIEPKCQKMSERPDDDEEYNRIFGLMRKDDRMAFRLFIISTNIKAYNVKTKIAAAWFLSWDVLEDAMPFLTQPTIKVDIQWTKSDLEQKVKELGLKKHQIVVLINPSKLNVIPKDSAVLLGGEPSAIRVIMNKCVMVSFNTPFPITDHSHIPKHIKNGGGPAWSASKL